MNTNIKQVAGLLQSYGNNGDTVLAHITPEEAQLLKDLGGAGTINPDTGLIEFGFGSFFSSIGNFIGDTVGGAVDTVGAFVKDPVKFTKNVGEGLLDNPEKIALLVAAYYAPELLSEFAPEVLSELAVSADFAATDAANLAAQGLSESQIASTLSQSGVEEFVANDAARLATQGLTQQAIAQNLANTGLNAYSASQVTTPIIGDQVGDFPTPDVNTGAYGNPMAEGVKEATQDLLKYNADYATPSLLTPKNAIDALKLGNQLFGQQVNPLQPMQAGAGGQMKKAGVDYSPTLNLLQSPRASTPNIYSLLG
jgi:hypothetical protein